MSSVAALPGLSTRPLLDFGAASHRHHLRSQKEVLRTGQDIPPRCESSERRAGQVHADIKSTTNLTHAYEILCDVTKRTEYDGSHRNPSEGLKPEGEEGF